MAVPTAVTDLSITAASNSPAGADTVASNTGPDEYLRALGAILRREQAQFTATASATTVDLGAIATGNYGHITGTTTITGFGTVAAGVSRIVVFDGALTLTHNATSLILPGGANITTAAGDVAEFVSEGSGNWRCASYVKATGYQPLDSTLTSISGDTLLPTIADGTMGAFSHRNKIINGGFAVNQRVYVSGAAVGAGLYGHDRWKMAASADTYTFSTTANKTTVTIPAGKVLQQVVEGLNLQSGTYTLSWEGTAQGKIGAGSPSASGVTGSITGGTDTTIEFGPGTVANIQLEFGSIATPFENRPYGTELALCQRYYEIMGDGTNLYPNVAGYQSAAGGASIPIPFKVTKRAVPTLAVTGTWAVTNCGQPTAAQPSISGFSFNVVVTALGQFQTYPNSSDDTITASCEL